MRHCALRPDLPGTHRPFDNLIVQARGTSGQRVVNVRLAIEAGIVEEDFAFLDLRNAKTRWEAGFEGVDSLGLGGRRDEDAECGQLSFGSGFLHW